MTLRGAVLALVLITACNGNGDDEPRIPAAQFAAETCDDLAAWGPAMDSAFATATFDAAWQATRDLRAQVEARAAPAVDGGGDVKAELLDAIDTLEDALAAGNEAEIAGSLAALDPTGANPELQTAFSQADACDEALANLG